MPDFPALHYLIYRSQASRAVHEVTLPPLLRKARQHNQDTAITGVLLYAKGQFLQVLEGPEPELSRLYARIKADPRHFAIRTLAYGPLAERAFPDWRMAYAPASAEFIDRASSYLNLEVAPSSAPPPSPALFQLLRDFVEGMTHQRRNAA